jgi:hypothetical protein
MAITHSPTFSLPTSPSLTAGRPVASILTTATSVRLSAPMTRALNSRLSVRVTISSSAPSTTCALVITKPSALRMKPEPTPRCWGSSSPWPPPRGAPRPPGSGMPKRRKNSSMLGSMPPPPGAAELRPLRSRVRMLTTDGPTFSTSSEKSGNSARACAWANWGAQPAARPRQRPAATARRRPRCSGRTIDAIRSDIHSPLERRIRHSRVAGAGGQKFNACVRAATRIAAPWPSAPRPPR